MAEKGLGKGPGAGLGALFGGEFTDSESAVQNLPISKVEPRKEQPRSNFDEDALEELADSISRYGVIQPITVRKLESGYYQIIAGERRWRASRMAGLDEIPAQIIEADDMRVIELALVENLQREDLNPLEEARGYRKLMDEHNLTQEQAAQSVGKSRSAVANSLRLLSLEPEVLGFLEIAVLSAGHARALLAIRDPDAQIAAAKKVIEQGLSVRQTETLAAKLSKEVAEQETETPARLDYRAELERELTESLGRRVAISIGAKKGRVQLEFYGKEDMEALFEALGALSKLKRENL